jgi:hypothetical protein
MCKLRGHIQGIIPGTKGAGVWKIETTSYYSLAQIREQMEMVQRITHRLQGLINEKKGEPVFWLRKVTDSISRVDVEKGEATRTEQDLIYLEADIDMYELITNYQPQKVLERGQNAQALLAGNPGTIEPSTDTEKQPRAYKLKHYDTTTAEAAPKTETKAEGETLDSFIPEIEYLDDQGEDTGKDNADDALDPITASSIIHDHYRAELNQCGSVARYKELATEFKAIPDGKIMADDLDDLKTLWQATATRLRGDLAA